MKKTTLLLPIVVSMLLVGCGGGGGGTVKSVISPPVGPATLTTNSSVSLDATSNEVDYTASPILGRALTTVDRGITGASTADLTYDSSGNLSKLVITTPNSILSWDLASADTFKSVTGFSDQIVLEDSAKTYAAVLIDPKVSSWNYQTFGAWRTGFGAGLGVIGGVSAGLKTEGIKVPTVGGATFTGKLLGAYVAASGIASFVEGVVTVVPDFASRSLAFTTSSTNEYNLSNGATFSASKLNMSGTLAYSSGVNSFSGAVVAPVAGLTGTASGAFYGPNAEELGGVFNVKASSGMESYSGSFGASK